MKQTNEGATIASTAVEAIKDYLQDFERVSKLYKDLALAQTQVRQIIKNYGVYVQEFDEILDVFNQHYMLIELLEPFEESAGKEERV